MKFFRVFPQRGAKNHHSDPHRGQSDDFSLSRCGKIRKNFIYEHWIYPSCNIRTIVTIEYCNKLVIFTRVPIMSQPVVNLAKLRVTLLFFLVYLMFQLVIDHRDELLSVECEMSAVHHLLCTLPRHIPQRLEKLIEEAHELFKKHSPQKLENACKRSLKERWWYDCLINYLTQWAVALSPWRVKW